MRIAAGLLVSLHLARGAAHGLEQSITLEAGKAATLNLPWTSSMQETAEPRGYNHHGALTSRPRQRLIIENTGSTPLTELRIIVNGSNGQTPIGAEMEGWRRSAAGFPRALFFYWTQARSHAASGSRWAENPQQMLQTWGYTLCGEDTKAFASVLAQQKIPARSVPLNGHVVGEYYFDGQWAVLDGDQNIAYLSWDNKSLASYEEIRADPLLALRTKPFGRFASWTLAAAQFNAGLFEYIQPAEPKPLKPSLSKDAGPGSLALYPGERLIYHYDRTPEHPIGKAGAPEARKAAPAALRMVELQVLPPARGWKAGPLSVSTPWPILGEGATPIVNPSYSITLKINHPEEPVSIWMQGTVLSLPQFRPGVNSMEIQASSAGDAMARIEYEAEVPAPPQAPRLTSATPNFVNAEPEFSITLDEGVGRIWWQISEHSDFSFVLPNLEQIQPALRALKLNLLTCSFLRAGTPYYLRIKTVRKGVWSAWSDALPFQVEKPSAPTDLQVSALPDGRVHLTWKGDADEFAVFGSNRLGFLPEIYADGEIVEMRDHEVLSSRPNHNLLGTVAPCALDIRPTTRFLRVIGRRGQAWSTPSALLEIPAALAAGLPPPTVFQIRWSSVPEPTEHDLYRGAERPLR